MDCRVKPGNDGGWVDVNGATDRVEMQSVAFRATFSRATRGKEVTASAAA